MSFDFRFYGVEPTDWAEGANDGHVYDVTFANAPDAPTRATIATTWEGALKKSGASTSEQPWRWSNRSARLQVGEAKRGKKAPGLAFAAVRDAMQAIHAVAPIEQVVFRNSRWEEDWRAWGKSAWDKWSKAQQAEPDDAFAEEGRGRPDAAFERARRVAKLGEKAVREDEARIQQALDAGALCPVTIDEDVKPWPVDASILKAAFPYIVSEHDILGSPSGRIVLSGARVPGRIGWVDHDGAIQTFGDNDHFGFFRSTPSPSPNGQLLLVHTWFQGKRHESILILDLATRAVRTLLTADDDMTYLGRCGWIDDDRIAVANKRGLHILDTQGAHLAANTEEEVKCMWMYGLYDGRVVFVADRYDLSAYRVDGGRVERFAKGMNLPNHVETWWCDGREVRGVQRNGLAARVMNIEAAWEARYGEPLR